ncbi:signal recognition particle subunit [Mortierella claussenii]|nr:signal recognition particle subunit [Mortierella claussenii]
MSKNSSLNQLRKGNKESFFLPDSDEEQDVHDQGDDDFDVDNMDFPLPSDGTSSSSALDPANAPLTPEQMAQIQALMDTGAVKSNNTQYISAEDAEQFKSWMCLYPCYIDGTKTVAEGRRIPKSEACVKQPWAKDIVEALKELRLSQAFEPGKTHPRDWANRGRVRVLFKDNGRFCHSTIHTKNELLVRLAAIINKNHAKDESAGHKRSEFSPLSPLTPLSIVMPGMANADPLAGLLGSNDTTEPSSAQGGPSAASPNPNQPKSKRQEKLAKKPKRVMIRG